MRFSLMILAGIFGFAGASRADERPAGPPWNAVCQDFEKDAFSLVFYTPQCQSEFQEFYDAHTPLETHQWMKGRRECFHEWAHFAWIVFAQDSAKMAELAWRQQIFMTEQRVLGGSCADHECAVAGVKAELARAEGLAIGDETKAHTSAFLDTVEQDKKYEPQMTKAYDSVTGLCLYHLNVECIGALKQAFDWMYPRMYVPPVTPIEHFTFGMLPFYRQVFADQPTQVYAARLALKLMDFVGSTGATPAQVQESLYEMGVAAFDGDLDRFWNFMIVYATRGAAWAAASPLVGSDNRPLFTAYMVISAAMGVLDTAQIGDGRAFSYAPTQGFTCFQPKPYHFWMAGGFAYMLRKQGYTEKTAELVARLTGALYEVASTTEGRDPDAVFFVPEFATIVNRERRELTHHAVGAQLGLHPVGAPALEFDAKFGEFLDASTPLPAVSAEEMRKKIQDPLTRWQLWTSLTGWYLKAN